MGEPLKLVDDLNAELRARLVAARAARQALDEERAAKEADAALLAEVEEEERKLAHAKAVRDAEDKHGAVGKSLAVIPTDQHGVIIVKKPNHVLFRKWRDSEDMTSCAKMEELITPCVVFPDRPQFSLIIQDQPALIDTVCTQVAALAGFRLKGAAGKP